MKLAISLSALVLALGVNAQFGSDTIKCQTSGGSPTVADARKLAQKMKDTKKGTIACIPKDIAHQDDCVHLKYNTGTAAAQLCGSPRCSFDPSGPACTGAGCGYPVGLGGDDLDQLIDKCKSNGKVGGIYTTNGGNTHIKLIHS